MKKNLCNGVVTKHIHSDVRGGGCQKNFPCNHFPTCKHGCPRVRMHLMSLPNLAPLLQFNRWCIVNHVCLLDNNEFGVANMVVVVQHGNFFSCIKLHDIHSLVVFDLTHLNPT
jgi:hypothetical protein